MGENSPFHPWKAQHIGSKHESTKAEADLDGCHKSGFISDIVILHGCGDICDKPWVQPFLCIAMWAWFKLQHVHEEDIKIIAIEATQVWTSINKEEACLCSILDTTCPTNPVLAAYISSISQYCLNTNTHLHTKLTQLAKQGHYVAQHREGSLLPSLHSNAETSLQDANEPVRDMSQLGNINDEHEDSSQMQDLEDKNDDDIMENVDYLHIIGRVTRALETMDLNLM